MNPNLNTLESRAIGREFAQEYADIKIFDNQHALIIGINDYANVSKLKTAINDAEAIATILQDKHNYKVSKAQNNANRASIINALNAFAESVGKNDCAVFYFAGHGIAIDSEEGMEGYIVPSDADSNKVETLISMSLLNNVFNGLCCRHFLLILDCCFAGSFKWSIDKRDLEGQFLPKKIYKERFERYILDNAWQVITSAGYDQKAFDVFQGFKNNRDTNSFREHREGVQHSPFADALINALNGAADIVPANGGDGIITATELYLYLRENVELPTYTDNKNKRQTPSIFFMPKHDKGEFIFFSPNHPFNLESRVNKNPFMGLNAFDEKDADLFYGREKVLTDLLKKVETLPLIVVVGASGTGKSSVVKAGLIPLLKERNFNILPTIRPTQKPLEVIKNHPIILKNTILIIDQFEELITQSNQEDSDKFMDILRGYLEEGIKIVITVRSDFEPQFDTCSLKKYWHTGRFVVPPFSIEELREVIARPMVQEVLQFDVPQLIDTILTEVIQSPGALPLLSFTLSELYEMSDKNTRTLKAEDYRKLGGVIGSLRKKADGLYESLNTAEQVSMQHLMLRIVSIASGEYAGKRLMHNDLVFTDAAETIRINIVKNKLIAARLIVSGKTNDGVTFIEPAHDALVRAWPKLIEWIRFRGEENVLLQNKLTEAVNDYDNLKDKDLLWHNDPRLEILRGANQTWMNAREQVFVQKSVQLKKRNRSRLIAILTTVLIALSGLTIWALKNQNTAELEAKKAIANEKVAQEQRNEAVKNLNGIRVGQARELTTKGDNLLRFNEKQDAILEYEKALKLLPKDSIIMIKTVEMKIREAQQTSASTIN
jgi:hypothetical protein